MSLKDKIKAKSQQFTEVEIESLGEKVFLKQMTGAERVKYIGMIPSEESQEKILKAQDYMIAISLYDENKNRVFSDNEVEQIGEMPAAVIDELAVKIAEINGFGAEKLKAEIKN